MGEDSQGFMRPWERIRKDWRDFGTGFRETLGEDLQVFMRDFGRGFARIRETLREGFVRGFVRLRKIICKDS